MNDFPHPLRLAVGSHSRGSGKGCAMNVLSYENGDAEITDMPGCADPMLTHVVQRVNDSHCTHRDGDLLCPSCSMEVLALAHRTVGTRLGLPREQVARIHVTLAVESAESVLDRTQGEAPRRAVALVRRWLAGEAVTASELRADAADANAAHAAAYADAAAAYAAYAAAHAAYAAYAAHADVAAYAAYAAPRLDAAHHLIDRFEALTGVRGTAPAPEITAAALAALTA